MDGDIRFKTTGGEAQLPSYPHCEWQFASVPIEPVGGQTKSLRCRVDSQQLIGGCGPASTKRSGEERRLDRYEIHEQRARLLRA
jgi:hypothetical protein